jgi:hypothetical protein
MTGTTRSRVARADGPTSRSTVPATVWAPPPTAVGERWRAWLLSAIDRALLPAHGRRVDLTAHLVDEPHDQRLPPSGLGRGEGDGERCAAKTTQSAPATPYWAALIRDHPAASAITASTSPPVDPTSPTGAAMTDPATAGPVRVAPAPTAAGEHADPANPTHLADLVLVDLAGTAADDRLGILASRALRGGGLLAVLTHCHHTVDRDSQILHRRRGENVLGGDRRGHRDFNADAGAGGFWPMLVDPTGSVVASAQNADLLYLQHIVIPTRPLAHPAAADQPDLLTATDPQPPPPRHHSPRRAPHRVGHADLLVFARPAMPPPLPPPAPASQPTRTGTGTGTGTGTANLAVGCATSPDDGSRS